MRLEMTLAQKLKKKDWVKSYLLSSLSSTRQLPTFINNFYATSAGGRPKKILNFMAFVEFFKKYKCKTRLTIFFLN